MDLLIATSNPGKLREYYALLQDMPVRAYSLRDVGLGGMDVEEVGETVEAIAEHKARAYAQASGLYTLADDTGLMVDALDGRPGIYSRRYGTPDLDDEGRYRLLLRELEHVPDDRRTARFVCAVALYNPETEASVMATGVCEGYIARQPQGGVEGFGYDAVFVPVGYRTSLGALSLDEKNRVSHRGDALRRLLPFLAWLPRVAE